MVILALRTSGALTGIGKTLGCLSANIEDVYSVRFRYGDTPRRIQRLKVPTKFRGTPFLGNCYPPHPLIF